MADKSDDERLEQLESRLKKMRTTQQKPDHRTEHYSQAQTGWRMVTELVAGLGIGFGIGYGLDHLLGTLPIFLVLFTLVGLAAGIKTMLATARDLNTPPMPQGGALNDED